MSALSHTACGYTVMRILTINSSSATIRYRLYDLGTEFLLVSGKFDISGDDSKVKVLVVTTNEELEIARQVVSVIN